MLTVCESDDLFFTPQGTIDLNEARCFKNFGPQTLYELIVQGFTSVDSKVWGRISYV